MSSIVIQLAKYFMIILAAVYTFMCFSVFYKKNQGKKSEEIYKKQTILIYLIQIMAYIAMFSATGEKEILIEYGYSVLLLTAIQLVYRFVYLNASVLLVNNMCMLLMTGMVILTRLDTGKAKRQMMIAAGSLLISAFVPLIMNRFRNRFRKMKWIYAGTAVLLLCAVLVVGKISYGAKISIAIGGVSVQPAEFVILLYVFFVAVMYHEATSKRQIIITSAVAALQVLLLVASKDLGGALILFVIYVVMIYIDTKKWYYLLGSGVFVFLAMLIGEKLFHHVQVRVLAWRDPLSVIYNEGYQISQSLFAIGTGGWFGTGLCQGKPDTIPVVAQDFVFSAIAEEMGAIYAVCIIMVCFSCLVMFFNIAMQMKDSFYKYAAFGMGTSYGFQVFLTIGGVIKLIPSTGVTLPLVSYGGSSILATFMMFALIQSLYILNDEKRDTYGKKEKGKS